MNIVPLRRKQDWISIGGYVTILGVIWAAISWGSTVVGSHKTWMLKVDRAVKLEPRIESLEKSTTVIDAKLDVILLTMGVDPSKVKIKK